MRNGWIPSALAILVLLAAGSRATAEGWSWTSPFSSGAKDTSGQAKSNKSKSSSNVSRTAMIDGRPLVKPSISPQRKEPSALDKVGSGTKKFFTRTADAISFKKPAPKKKPSTSYAWGSSQKTPQPKLKKKDQSWFSSWFAPKEPKPPESVGEWLALKRPN
ncbi:MAG: hypothetical protein ACYC35_01835 [Pirellulales bacterium]